VIYVRVMIFYGYYIAREVNFHFMGKHIYNRIKAVLAEKDVTNKELAEALDKGLNTVSRWCTNEAQPSIQTFYEIAEYLDVNVSELLVDYKKK
jgi:putative transcriptional regulator